MTKISQFTIDKLSLKLSKDTLGASFMTGCKIYLWPAMSDTGTTTHVMECDLAGQPLKRGIRILFRDRTTFRFCDINQDLVLNFTEAKLIHFVKKELGKCRPRAHGYNQTTKG